jgi:hypothetical protein
MIDNPVGHVATPVNLHKPRQIYVFHTPHQKEATPIDNWHGNDAQRIARINPLMKD